MARAIINFAHDIVEWFQKSGDYAISLIPSDERNSLVKTTGQYTRAICVGIPVVAVAGAAVIAIGFAKLGYLRVKDRGAYRAHLIAARANLNDDEYEITNLVLETFLRFKLKELDRLLLLK